MRKDRILSLVIILFVIICAFTGCKEKELGEVYTKFSDKEITFLCQEPQTITVEITIVDGEMKMNFEKRVSLNSNEVTALQLKNITDEDFLTYEAKITSVTIQKQEEHSSFTVLRAMIIVFVLMFGIGLPWGLISAEKVKKKTNRN